MPDLISSEIVVTHDETAECEGCDNETTQRMIWAGAEHTCCSWRCARKIIASDREECGWARECVYMAIDECTKPAVPSDADISTAQRARYEAAFEAACWRAGAQGDEFEDAICPWAAAFDSDHIGEELLASEEALPEPRTAEAAVARYLAEVAP
ncbi:MAG: hypothetical protein ACYDAR_14275 [Thermomicrobiales bacterium]